MKLFLFCLPGLKQYFCLKFPQIFHQALLVSLILRSKLSDNYFLSGTYLLETVSHDCAVPIHILNPHPHAILFYPRTKLAAFHYSDDVLAVEPAPRFDTADSSAADIVATDLSIDFNDSALNDSEKEQLLSLLQNYSDIFSIHSYDLGRTSHIDHHIDVQNSVPIHQRPYQVAPKHQSDITNNIQDMLYHDIIQPSVSPWSSPILLVPKKDGGTRFVIDYRCLNIFTRKDCYPLPRTDDTLDCLGGAQYFSALDFSCGYFQVPLGDESHPLTAFITQGGLYEFNVMPFGLCNAPSTFQHMMEATLRRLQWHQCLIYLDDVIVFSPNIR